MGRKPIYTEEERKKKRLEYLKQYREKNKEKLNAYVNEKMKEFYRNCEEYREKQKSRYVCVPIEEQKKRGRPRKMIISSVC